MAAITVSLETGNRMKEKGFRQDTVMGWYQWRDFESEGGAHWVGEMAVDTFKKKHLCAAPTLQEILEELPRKIEFVPCSIKDTYWLDITPSNRIFWSAQYGTIEGKALIFFQRKTPVEAAAILWLWCVDNGYIKQEGVK